MNQPYAPLGFEPYDHWYQRVTIAYGAPSQPRQYLPIASAFSRSDWEEEIITDMTSRPPLSVAEMGGVDPNSGANKRRRERLTRKIVQQRVMAGYLIEEASKLEETLDELGGPAGSLADAIHKTQALSAREVDKALRRALKREVVKEKPQRGALGVIDPVLNFLLLVITDPLGAVVLGVIVSGILTTLALMFLTH